MGVCHVRSSTLLCKVDLMPLVGQPSARHIFCRSLFSSVLERCFSIGAICCRLEEAMAAAAAVVSVRAREVGRGAGGVLPLGVAGGRHGASLWKRATRRRTTVRDVWRGPSQVKGGQVRFGLKGLGSGFLILVCCQQKIPNDGAVQRRKPHRRRAKGWMRKARRFSLRALGSKLAAPVEPCRRLSRPCSPSQSHHH